MVRWLTVVSLSAGTFGLVWAFGRRLFKFLSPLAVLPDMLVEQRSMKTEIREMKDQSQKQHAENKHDLAEHLANEHGRGRDSGSRNRS